MFNKKTSPWVIIPIAVVVVPFIVVYMLAFHPKQTLKAWKEARRW